MTALAENRGLTTENWTRKQLTLTSGTKAFKGGIAALVLGTGKVVPATGAQNQLVIGTFAEEVDAAGADKLVTVQFPVEKAITRFVNGTSGDAIAATHLGLLAYVKDDQTVTIVPTGSSPVGRIWDVSATKGIGVEALDVTNAEVRVSTAPAFAANDCVVPASLLANRGRTLIEVPNTAGVSTVTLPTTGVDVGTTVVFAADGAANGHTVQYRFGTTAITAALTASKIHQVICTRTSFGWAATSTVAP